MNLTSRPRLLLRRLHTLMAGPGSGQERLDTVVQEIGLNMVAEVCSVYLVRSGRKLELFATEGLNPEAVHHATLKVGEGLVGLIAERGIPLNLPEASAHPKFVYLPETGEEIYHSLLGVPIIRNGTVAGVLVVQNKDPRHYTEEEVEALQTVAMVLAELLGSGELIDPRELSGGGEDPYAPVVISGQGLSPGIAAGVAVLHEPKIDIERLVADDTETERERIQAAIEKMRGQLDSMIASSDMTPAGEHREILETYKMFAYDRGWHERILEAVDQGLTAEAAVERAQQDMRARMARTEDPYLRERLADLDDLSNRLIRTILVLAGAEEHHELTEPSVLLARTMGPAELLDYDRSFLVAVVLEEGSPTTHVAIIARALGIPMVGQAGGAIDRVEEGDRVIADADAGRVCIRPGEDVDATYSASLADRRALTEKYQEQRELPSISKDGVEISLMMNAGLIIDLANLDATNAAGIGLFRTEFQFMVSSTLPRMKAQTDLYGQVLDVAGDRPVVFRVLDVGSDKRVPFLPTIEEENPAMGWRALRLALDRPALLRYQVRALLTAAEGRVLKLMFPLIADVSEYEEAKAVVEREIERMERLGKVMPSRVEIGSMLEVPALMWQLDALLPQTDFLSVGTNDLIQFLFASDRSNARLVARYDPLSPVVMSVLTDIRKACSHHNVPLSVCGEMAGRPLEAMALLGLGITELSVSAPAIGPVKRMLRRLDVKDLAAKFEGLLKASGGSFRDRLKAYAKERDIPI